jgi:hypothetical protein
MSYVQLNIVQILPTSEFSTIQRKGNLIEENILKGTVHTKADLPSFFINQTENHQREKYVERVL